MRLLPTTTQLSSPALGRLTGRGRFTLLQRFAVISLLVFLLLGGGLAYLLGQSIEANALSEARQSANENFHDRLLRELRPSDLAGPLRGARYWAFQRFVHQSILSQRTVRVKVWGRDGTVIYSDDQRIVGKRFEIEEGLAEALHGETASDRSQLSGAENVDDRHFKELLEVYLPIQFKPHGPILGAFEVYQTYAPISAEIASTRRTTYMFLGGGLLLLYLLLFSVVGGGSRTITRQQRDVERYTSELEESYRQTISSLAAAVDARDSTTEQHSERVTRLAVALGRELGLSDEQLVCLERGALLHDVGKIGVSDTILLKPGKLNDEEWAQMRQHPEIGYRMLAHVGFLRDALGIVRYHHERWDGTGYPARLRGEQIPLAARLFAVIDVYDALTSDRPYRLAEPANLALWRIQADAGTHFDPAVVAAFVRMMSATVDGAQWPPARNALHTRASE